MATKTGTHTIADLQRNTFAGTSIADYGLDALNAAIQADLAVHNARFNEILGALCEVSDERTTVYGGPSGIRSFKKDEITRGPTQTGGVGSKVEFPLDANQIPIGWTADYLSAASVQDIAKSTIQARQAHLEASTGYIKDAVFGATNYVYTDRFVDSVDLTVKRLLNADGAPIPNGPNGEKFDASTHSHYNAANWAALTPDQRAQAVEDTVQDVVEHGHGAGVVIYINRAQESDFRALPGFDKLPPPNVTLGDNERRGNGVLDITRSDNRLIGYFNGRPVSTKPWVHAGYLFTYAAGDPAKPLRWRNSKLRTKQGLYIAGEIITHPLQARYMEHMQGVGAMNRTNGAVLYLGGLVYVEPEATS